MPYDRCSSTDSRETSHQGATCLVLVLGQGFGNLSYRSSGWFAVTKLSQHLVSVVENVSLLLHAHVHGVLVRISVKACQDMVIQRFLWHMSCFPATPYHQNIPISCPLSRIAAHWSGKVSSECPGIKNVAVMLYLSNIFKRRSTPSVPAKYPREISTCH